MNIDLNKRLKQHQENYYPAKKIEKQKYYFFA